MSVEIGRLRAKQRQQRKRATWAPGDTPVTFRIALALQALAPKDEAAAMEYVSAVVGASRCRQELGSGKFVAWLPEHEHLGLDPALSPKTHLGKTALRKARQF